MSFLENAAIKTKILSSLIPLCIVGMGAAGIMGYFYKNTDTEYSNYIATDGVAATYIARAATSMMILPYNAYQLTTYSEHDPAHEKIRAAYAQGKIDFQTRLGKALELTPENGKELGEIRVRAENIIALIDKAL